MFKELHIYVKAWLMSNIVMQDYKQHYLHDWINEKWSMKLIKNNVTKCLVVELENEVWFAFSGTCSWRGWLHNLMFWNKEGFHYGISKVTKDLMEKYLKQISYPGNNKRIYITGHSQGGAAALYFNYMLKKIGISATSVGFCLPYIASKSKGLKELKKLCIDHNNIIVNSSGKYWGDIVDNVGSLRAKHYGNTEILDDRSFLFSHNYINITKSLWTWFEENKWMFINEDISKETAALNRILRTLNQ